MEAKEIAKLKFSDFISKIDGISNYQILREIYRNCGDNEKLGQNDEHEYWQEDQEKCDAIFKHVVLLMANDWEKENKNKTGDREPDFTYAASMFLKDKN